MRAIKFVAVTVFAVLALEPLAVAKVPHGSASDSQGGAVAPKPFGTSFTGLKYKKKFIGKVTSTFSADDIPNDQGDVVAEANSCTAGRQVSLYRAKKGKDVLVKSALTKKTGVFRISAKKQGKKKYYVAVTKKEFLWWEYQDASTGSTEMNFALCKKAKANF